MNCSQGVNEIPAQRVFLQGFGLQVAQFEVFTSDSKGQANSCQAVLQNADAEIIDQKQVNFTTTDQVTVIKD